MGAVLRIEVSGLTRSALSGDAADDVTEEARDGSCGHVDVLARRRAQVDRWLDQGATLRVELEYGIGGAPRAASGGDG